MGLCLGFFGLPTVVRPPTAVSATATQTVAGPTVEVTVTAGGAQGTHTPLPASPSGTQSSSLTLLDPINDDPNVFPLARGATSLKGTSFPDALLRRTCDKHSTGYNLANSWKKLTATVGIADDSKTSVPVTVDVIGDGRPLATAQAVLGDPRALTADVTGVTRLTITYQASDCNNATGPTLVIAQPTLG
ncbi:NPCBM/NEW2 domain-containing protein [Streptomyces sp. NPDC060048]|uniref:NPCBM/NEW2 domain-containing protein n=1 Tax=unclassified Streptomyces TaxID=2593676 RepID=UPI00368814B1